MSATAEKLADLVARLLQPYATVKRAQTTTNSEVVIIESDDQKFNITITPARK